MARVEISLEWDGHAADALIALHARRSAASIQRFQDRFPGRGLGLVLTGTDVYRDIAKDRVAAQSLDRATHLVVLQSEALRELTPRQRERARVIVQSASRRTVRDKARRTFDMVAVGHLRDEKDPATMIRAAARVATYATVPPIRFIHIGNPLDADLATLARGAMAANPRYQWLGGVPHATTRRWIARSRALVHASRMEGGANVVIEAIRSGVPVLASRIPGNIGLLGRDYRGYFPIGDDHSLAKLMARFVNDRRFARELARQCAARAPLFSPAAERAAVRALAVDLLDQETTQ